MEDETTAKNHPHTLISGVLIIVLALGVWWLFSIRAQHIDAVTEEFRELRNELAADSLGVKQRELSEQYKSLFGECEEQGLYDSYVDSDSRYMSAAQLREALLLHEGPCGQLLRQRGDLTLGFFKKDIDHLVSIANLFPTSARSKAEKVADYWQKIYALEREHTALYGRMVDIQGEYWQIELDKALRFISSTEREAAVGALNYEANTKLERLDVVVDLNELLREEERAYWNEHFVLEEKTNASSTEE